MCVCVCLFVRERLMYKSSEPKQALINGARWSAGKGKQQLNELAPPSWRIIAFHQQILVADTQTHRHTTDEGVIFFFSPFNFSICSCKTALYFSRETTGSFSFPVVFVLFWMSAVFECGGVHNHEDRWMWRWCNNLSLCLSRCLVPFFSLLSLLSSSLFCLCLFF